MDSHGHHPKSSTEGDEAASLLHMPSLEAIEAADITAIRRST